MKRGGLLSRVSEKYGGKLEVIDNQWESVSSFMPFEITGPAKWISERLYGSGDKPNYRDEFPIIRQPFDKVWYEFESTVPWNDEVLTYGCYCWTIGWQHYLSLEKLHPPSDQHLTWTNHVCLFTIILEWNTKSISTEIAAIIPLDKNGNSMMMDGFLWGLRPVGQWKDPDGGLRPVSQWGNSDLKKEDKIDEKWEIARFYSEYVMNCVLFATALMHCKNVEIRDLKQYKKQKKRKKSQPIINYKTLIIDPLKKQIKANSKSLEEDSIRKALHICRGHFKTYTEANPLFGSVTGCYWWAAHARGHKKYGTVIKDYKVGEPDHNEIL